MQDPVLVCEGITKSYANGVPVLRDFSCTLPTGKIVGLLGPNGCGKSTLIKLIAGLLVPDSGRITVAGKERSEATCALVSYLPERPYFTPSMKVDALLRFFTEFYEDFDEVRAREMLADLGIDPSAKLRTLSKGTKEKVQLILVMARRARLYLLDEPIAGVDPAARDYILDTILKNRHEDSTILITTHLIHDIEQVLDEFAFLGKDGKIILAGNAEATRAERGMSLDALFREVFRC